MAANMNSSLVMRIVSASVAVSNRASQIIRDVMKKGDLGIIEKGKNDFQTEADRSAQRCIMASLHKQFPNVKIFGEEGETFVFDRTRLHRPHFASPTISKLLSPKQNILTQLEPEKIPADFIELGFSEDVLKHNCPKFLEDAKDDKIVIWVDPLDGTAEYTQGYLDHVTVLIGIAVNGHAVGGVINQPFYNYQDKEKVMGRCIWGVCQVGAFGFTRDELPSFEDNLILTTSRSHSNRMVTETLDALNPKEVVRVGGAGHKVLLLIEGKVHAYIFATKGCKKWDTCAPEAILHAVGGTLTDMFGITMSYGPDVQRLNAGGVLATTSNHQYFVGKVPDHVLENLEESVSPEPLANGVCLRGDNKGCRGEIREQQTVQQEMEPSGSPKGSESPSSDVAQENIDTKL